MTRLALVSLGCLLAPAVAQTDLCLTRLFLGVAFCDQIASSLNNETLGDAGWKCCWDMVQSAPGNPFLSLVLPILQIICSFLLLTWDGQNRAWMTLDDDGAVEKRCLARGTCDPHLYW